LLRRYLNGLIFKLNNSIRNAIQCPGRNAPAVGGISPPITNTTFGQQLATTIDPAMQQSHTQRGYDASTQRHTTMDLENERQQQCATANSAYQ
jgi:hypothetical protein